MALSLSSSYSLSFSHSHAPALSRGVNARHSRDSRVQGHRCLGSVVTVEALGSEDS